MAWRQTIRIHDKVLLCCSTSSLSSWWVKDRIRKALEKERQTLSDVVHTLRIWTTFYFNGGMDSVQISITPRRRLQAGPPTMSDSKNNLPASALR